MSVSSPSGAGAGAASVLKTSNATATAGRQKKVTPRPQLSSGGRVIAAAAAGSSGGAVGGFRRKSSRCVATGTSIRRQALLLQKAFRQEKKDWNRPTTAFASRAPRLLSDVLPQSHGAANSAYEIAAADTEAGVIERVPVFCGQYLAPKTRPNTAGPAFRSTAPQRPDARKALCDAMMTPRPLVAVKSKPLAAPPFYSSGPRIAQPKKLLPAQHELAYAIPADRPLSVRTVPPPTTLIHPGHKGRIVGNMSKEPRLLPPRKTLCEVFYQDVSGKDWLLPGNKVSNFKAGAMPQRPAVQARTDLLYDAKFPSETTRKNPIPKSTGKRFPVQKAQAPPVGTYTSRFVSCGLQS